MERNVGVLGKRQDHVYLLHKFMEMITYYEDNIADVIRDLIGPIAKGAAPYVPARVPPPMARRQSWSSIDFCTISW